MFYVLDDGGEPVLCDIPRDIVRVGDFLRDARNRRVAWTERGEVAVSTVFLAIDHRHFGKGRPVLWETMVRREGKWYDQERYDGFREAIRGHEKKVAEIWCGDAPETQWGSLVMRLREGEDPEVVPRTRWVRLLGPDLV